MGLPRWLMPLVAVVAIVVAFANKHWYSAGLDLMAMGMVMHLLPWDASVQLRCCAYTMQTVANRGQERQNLAHRAGLITGAVKAMRRHQDALHVQILAAQSLEAIALFNRETSLAVADAGAIEAVVDLLRKYPMHPEVQKLTACLSSFNDFVPENRPRIRAAGGIELIFLAMRNHYNNPDVLFRTGCAISATSGDAGVAEAMAANDGIPFLVQMMRDHLKSYRVGQEIMQATRNMQHIDAKYREELLRNGFVDAALDTIRGEMHERGTPTIGSSNLALVAFRNATLQNELLEKGAVELVLEALDRYTEKDLRGYGGVSTSFVWPTVPSANQALWSIAEDNAAAQERIVAASGIERIVAALKTYPDDGGIQMTGCFALITIVASNKTRQQLAMGLDPPRRCQDQLLTRPPALVAENLRQLGRF